VSRAPDSVRKRSAATALCHAAIVQYSYWIYAGRSNRAKQIMSDAELVLRQDLFNDLKVALQRRLRRTRT